MKDARNRVTRRMFFVIGGLGALLTVGAPEVALGQAPPTIEGLPPVLGDFVSQEEQAENIRVVNAFCAAFATKDFAKAESLLAENVVYRVSQDAQFTPIKGRSAVAERVKGMMGRDKVEFKVFRTVAFGPLVLNERDDQFTTKGDTRRIYIAGGMFYLEKGKIAEWTDYVAR